MSEPTQDSLNHQIARHVDGLALDPAQHRQVVQALAQAVHDNPLIKRVDEVSLVGQQVFAVYRPHGQQPPLHQVHIQLEQALVQPLSEPPVVDGWLSDPGIVR